MDAISTLSSLWEFANALFLIGGFVLSVVNLVRLTWSLWHDPDRGPAYVRRTYYALGTYIVSCALAVTLLIVITGGKPCPDQVALSGTLFVLLWCCYGAIWLIRTVPREAEPPALLMKPFGTLDMIIIVSLLASVAIAALESEKCGAVISLGPAGHNSFVLL